jgi:AraC-like DNA-binding protein
VTNPVEATSLALAAVERLVRPPDLGGAVELAIAAPKSRTFPTRLSESLGVCLKFGGAHAVRAEGRALAYPADSVCVRSPGTVWSTADTGPVGFLSIDVAPALLPAECRGGMRFVRPAQLPDLPALARLLLAPQPRLRKDEALSNLVAALVTSGALEAPETLDHASPRAALDRARAFLQSSLESNPSLDDVARAAGMNKHVLVRHFRKRFGTTPHAYLVMAKVEDARRRLARGDAAIEVAATLGFADQAHLTRVFRDLVGLTPAAYRRRVRTAT